MTSHWEYWNFNVKNATSRSVNSQLKLLVHYMHKNILAVEIPKFVWIPNILKSVFVVPKLYWWTALGCLIIRGMLFPDKSTGVFYPWVSNTLGITYSWMNAISTTHRCFKIFSWENMCENKHTKARKYRRNKLAGGKIVINRRKSLISIDYLNLLHCPCIC